jgi:hypothetical protein
MCCVLQNKRDIEPTFQFIDRKRSEGKPYVERVAAALTDNMSAARGTVYMIAGANKFLRIYYARVKACVDALESPPLAARSA